MPTPMVVGCCTSLKIRSSTALTAAVAGNCKAAGNGTARIFERDDTKRDYKATYDYRYRSVTGGTAFFRSDNEFLAVACLVFGEAATFPFCRDRALRNRTRAPMDRVHRAFRCRSEFRLFSLFLSLFLFLFLHFFAFFFSGINTVPQNRETKDIAQKDNRVESEGWSKRDRPVPKWLCTRVAWHFIELSRLLKIGIRLVTCVAIAFGNFCFLRAIMISGAIQCYYFFQRELLALAH